MNSKAGTLGLVGHNKYMLFESFSLNSYGDSFNKLKLVITIHILMKATKYQQ